jgi:hypothetical protein
MMCGKRGDFSGVFEDVVQGERRFAALIRFPRRAQRGNTVRSDEKEKDG